jgi:hypothetical protein
MLHPAVVLNHWAVSQSLPCYYNILTLIFFLDTAVGAYHNRSYNVDPSTEIEA